MADGLASSLIGEPEAPRNFSGAAKNANSKAPSSYRSSSQASSGREHLSERVIRDNAVPDPAPKAEMVQRIDMRAHGDRIAGVGRQLFAISAAAASFAASSRARFIWICPLSD
ncbi:MAG: hypothetical protein R3F54_31075 [Alphaproteobacteria bacterium]